MRINVLIVASVFLSSITSCSNKNTGQDGTLDSTSLSPTATESESNLNAQRTDGISKHVDNSFDDFFYLFSKDASFQKERILPAVTVDDHGNKSSFPSSEWKYNEQLVDTAYYTLFFSSNEALDKFNIGDLKEAAFLEISLDNLSQVEYGFEKKEGKWMMTKIAKNEVKTNSFLSFYTKFVKDSVFQRNHINNHILFISYDPDDEFELMEAEIDKEQWLAFKPVFVTTHLSVLQYQESTNESNSPTQLVQLNGLDNGFNVILHFRKGKKGEWMLFKYEDLSI